MKRLNLPLLMLSTALASGCASAPTATFWTKKGDTVFVHHVSGKIDKTEKLTSKSVSTDEATKFGITKGQKAFQVANQVAPAPTPVSKPEPKKAAKGDSKDKSELARVTSKLDELKQEVKSLKEQVSSASTASTQPAPQAPESVAQQAEDNPPRMSQ